MYRLLLFLVPFLFLFSCFRFYSQKKPSPLEIFARQGEEGNLVGTVYQVVHTEKSNRIYIKNPVFITKEEKTAFKGCVLLYSSFEEIPKLGNVILVNTTLQAFQSASNQGQFDEYQYRKIRGIDAMAYVETIKIISDREDWTEKLQILKNKLSKVYDQVLEEKEASVIKAMVLGEKAELDKEVKNLYSENGIVHILTISGLHISMLGILFYRLLKKAVLFLPWEIGKQDKKQKKLQQNLQRFYRKMIEVIPVFCSAEFVYLYGKMTGYAVSVNRAVIMFLLMMFAEVWGRTYDSFTGMAAAVLVILLRKPLYILDSGFWLSFLSVFAILVVLPVWEEMFPKNLCYFMEKVRSMLLAGFSIFLVTLPIVIKMYFAYPLYGSILNLFIIPLMSLLLPIAFLTGMTGLIFYPLAAVPAILVTGILNFYESLCRLVKTFPGAIQLTGLPSERKIFLYFFLLVLLLFLWKKFHFYRVGVFLGMILLIGFMYRLPSSSLQIHFLDIGQGDSVVLELPSGGIVTVDGGSSGVSSVGEYRLLPFLKSCKSNMIECAFLTHMDKDHISAIQELLDMDRDDIYIKRIVVPIVFRENETWKEIQKKAEEKGTKLSYIKAGDEFEINHVLFQCLNPSEELKDASENAASLVMKVTYGSFDLLLTGDVEGEGEQFLVEHYREELEAADVLKVAHHGSKNSTKEDFLAACHPAFAVISCGENNRYGHPHQELIERIENAGSKIFQTKDSGEITMVTDGKTMRWELFGK